MKWLLKQFILSIFLISGAEVVIAQIPQELNYKKLAGIMSVSWGNPGIVLLNGETSGFQLKKVRVHILLSKREKTNSDKKDNSDLFDAAVPGMKGNLYNQQVNANSNPSRIKEASDSYTPFVNESFLHLLFSSWISVHFNAEVPILLLPKR